jgi:diguanylate cyclase (GGDEF)-like protein
VKDVAALTYGIATVLWLAILVTVIVLYFRNPRIFGTLRLLLAVVALDTLRNIFENIYFGLFFSGQFGLVPKVDTILLGTPVLLIIPKLLNIGAGCLVLGVLLLRWLPQAVRERREAVLQAEHLHELATTDGMTGLWNRRQFMIFAEAEWQRFRRYHRPLSLLTIDIDHFKGINDRFGHGAGDEVIIRVAGICRAQKRASDIAGRLGGEEFAILLPETRVADAHVLAERLRDVISREIIVVTGGEISATVSIGLSEAAAAASMADFLEHSDMALYRAKRTGRNRVDEFAAAKELDTAELRAGA